jgi:transcriptional regulator with XRE-family HTH domain
MNTVLNQRIGERVSALKISWRRASLEAGLEAGFIQDIITGRSKEPSEQALSSLALVLKCSPAYLLGHTDEVMGDAATPENARLIAKIAERPDAVMALRIIEELLDGGHVEAARIAVRRALKAIALD